VLGKLADPRRRQKQEQDLAAAPRLNPTVIRRLLAEKTDAGLSATTVRHYPRSDPQLTR
jgi:hypothetical protein